MYALKNILLKKVILSFLVCCNIVAANAQTAISKSEVEQAGLWVVEITTLNAEEPQGEMIIHPLQPDNINFTYSNIVPCQIVVTLAGDTLFDSGPYVQDVSGATIRINGNTTAYYSNKLNMPYKLKLEKKDDMLCRGDNQRFADKNWRLLKDATTLNTVIGLKISQLIGMQWTPAYVPCNVIINGDYRGCYLLIETVRRNNSCRIATDKLTGYIVERDPYWWKEEKWFQTPWFENSNTYRWTWKYPDQEDVTIEKEQYISQYISDAEQAISDGGYGAYIDVESFAKWLLAHDILGTFDSGGSNMYFKKYDETDESLLEMPCLWDFDSNFRMTAGTFSRLHTSPNSYFDALLANHDKSFAKAYVRLWDEKKDELQQQIIAFINDYRASDECKALDNSRKLYNKRWGYTYSNVNSNINVALKWMQTHIGLLGENIETIDTTSANGLHAIPLPKTSEKYYNLKGIRLAKPAKIGITKYHQDSRTIITKSCR